MPDAEDGKPRTEWSGGGEADVRGPAAQDGRSSLPTTSALDVVRAQVSPIGASISHAIAPFLEQQRRLQISGIGQALEPFMRQLSYQQFHIADVLADSIAPQVLKSFELSATAGIADMLNSGGVMSAWRQGLLVEHRSQILAATSALRFEPIASSLLADLNRSSSVVARLGEQLARISTSRPTLLESGQRPTRQLRKFLDGLGDGGGARGLTLGVRATESVSSLTGTEIAYAGLVSRGSGGDALDVIEGEIISPWHDGPASARAELMEVLSAIDPTVPELLDGAWEDVAREGPAALVKIATCAVEALERTLRALAPETAVAAWLRQSNGTLPINYRPTYPERVRYLFRRGKSERRLVVVQVEALAIVVPELRSRLQAAKHASTGEMQVVRVHLVNVEAVLAQIVLGRQ